MKHFMKYILLVVIGLTLHACDDEFLNPLPESAIVVDAFFKTDDDVLAGIIGFMTPYKVSMKTQTQILLLPTGVFSLNTC